jgi:hypothetical protein
MAGPSTIEFFVLETAVWLKQQLGPLIHIDEDNGTARSWIAASSPIAPRRAQRG